MKSSTRDRDEGAGRAARGPEQQETLGRVNERPAPKPQSPAPDDDPTGRYQKKTGEIKKSFGR